MENFFFHFLNNSFLRLLIFFSAIAALSFNLQAQVVNYSDSWGTQGFSIEAEYDAGLKSGGGVNLFAGGGCVTVPSGGGCVTVSPSGGGCVTVSPSGGGCVTSSLASVGGGTKVCGG